MNRTKCKLWEKTSQHCRLINARNKATANGSFPGVRILFWPDGGACWPVNMYTVSLLRRGHAVSTVNTYVSSLSLFARFLYREKVALADVCNDTFYEFRDYLCSASSRSGHRRRRSNNQVNNLIERALAFVKWFHKLNALRSDIVAHKARSGTARTRGSRAAKNLSAINSLRHDSFVPRNSPRQVKPISRSIYVRLLTACDDIASSAYIKNRTRAILKVLCDTAARRSEAANIEVEDVEDAIRKGDGKLRLLSSKRRSISHRYVPISSSLLSILQNFIDVDRRLFIRSLRKRGVRVDCSKLFLTARGTAIHPETVTQDFARLRRLAGVEERATAHMLRHRWITLVVLEYIKSFKTQRLPLDIGSTMLTKIASMTGHKQINSLWTYVDLAFDEMHVWDEADVSLACRRDYEQICQRYSEIRRNVQQSDLSAEVAREALSLLEQLLPSTLNDPVR